jgi:hypothetical protein
MTLPAEVEALIGRGKVARKVAECIASQPGISCRDLAAACGSTVYAVKNTIKRINFNIAVTGWVLRGTPHGGMRLVQEADEPTPPRRRLTCIPPDMRPKRRRLTATPPGWPKNPVRAGNPGFLPVELGRGDSAAPAFSGDHTTGERA